MHTASLTFPFDDEPTARSVLRALEPEAAEGPDGTTTHLSLDGTTLHVEVTGNDLSGLRAAIHSVVRLLDAAQRTLA